MIRLSACGLAFVMSASGCAATTPILSEPRTLPAGETRLQIGGAALAPIGGDAGALAAARRTLASPPTPGPGQSGRDDVIRSVLPGAALAYAMRPGIAPLARASVGIQPRVEASLRYGGRDVGVGGRYLLVDERTEQGGAVTLSIGAEARTILRHRPEDGILPDALTDDVKGFGAVVPLIFGIRSDAGLVSAWAASLIGYDSVNARFAFPNLEADRNAAPFRSLSAKRLFAAVTLGVGLGFRSVRAGIELGIERDWIGFSSVLGDASARVWSLTPAFAVSTTL